MSELGIVFSIAFVAVKVAGVILALLGAGYLIFDNLLLKRLGRRTTIRIVLEGKVSRKEIVKLLEDKGYKVLKWK